MDTLLRTCQQHADVQVQHLAPLAMAEGFSEGGGVALVRFAFCKDEATLREAVDRMMTLRR